MLKKNTNDFVRARLTAGIKEAKRRRRQRLERDFNTNSSKIYMAGDTKCHRLQKQEHLHHMWGPTAGWAEHIPSLQQRLSCEVCSASRPPATVSNHSGREKTCYLNLLLTFSTRHSHRRLFPPSSKQPSSSPYLKVCCVESYIYDIATALHPVFTHRILDRRRQRHTPLCTSEELGKSRWTVTGSFELPSLRTYLGHDTWPRWSRKHSFCKNWSLFQGRLTDGPSASWLETSQTLVLHGPSQPRTGGLYSGWLNHQHVTGALLPSDNRSGGICCCTTTLQSSFIPQTVKPLKSSTLHFLKYCEGTQSYTYCISAAFIQICLVA